MIPMAIPVKTKDDSVVLWKLIPEMWWCLAICAEAHRDYGCPELVVTSAVDGKHMRGSLHYSGAAIDLRFWRYVERWEETATGWRAELKPQYWHLIEDLRERLGPDYDVVVEDDHLHVEYDPE